jgi:HlyD family secretion protein/epimerase transport system membrane fusion protein
MSAKQQVASYESRALQLGDYDLLGERLARESDLSGDRLLQISWAILIVTVFVIFGWTAFAPLNKGVTASGAVSTQSARQIVANIDGGIVKAINIKSGDRVQAGQVLLKLDDTFADTQYQLVRQQYLDHLGEKAMLEAEITGSPIRWPAEFTTNPQDRSIQQVMAVQSKVLLERRALRGAQKSVLAQQTARLNERIGGIKSQVTSLDSQGSLIGEELTDIEALYNQGYATKSRMLALQRSRADLQGRTGSSSAEIGQVQQAIGENRMQALQIDAQSRQESVARLATVQGELIQLIDKLANQKAVLARTTLVSPVNGVILSLNVNTVGGVVRPGEPIVEVVPTDDIIVVAKVRTQDVESLRIGQGARVKLPGLNAQTTPQLDGSVRYISADALTPTEPGPRYYELRVGIPQEQLKRLGKIKLSPGMPAEVLVDGGSRTALQYMLEPLTAAFARSFRD